MGTFVSSPTLVRFGVFEADFRSGELRKSGAKVKIQELPFQALRVLISHPNEVIDRDQLRQALWPDDVYVDFDRGVISAINRLRDALGDSAENPVFIEPWAAADTAGLPRRRLRCFRSLQTLSRHKHPRL